jgi:hypothetical protein
MPLAAPLALQLVGLLAVEARHLVARQFASDSSTLQLSSSPCVLQRVNHAIGC